MRIPYDSLLGIFSAVAFGASSAFAQGSLTPPGAPAPTMKTLDQVEARTALAGGTTPLTLSADGSYYLTGNLTLPAGNAITVTADNVTLDLNGFTISATSTSASNGGAIVYSGAGNLLVRNGNVVSTTVYNGTTFVKSGFVYGVYATSGRSIRAENVSVAGVAANGISVENARAVVSCCQVDVCGLAGITAPSPGSVIDHCYVHTCSGTGISGAEVSDCDADSVNDTAINAQTVHNCYGVAGTNGYGIIGATLSNCSGMTVSGYGISAEGGTNCKGYASGNGSGCFGTTLIGCNGTSNGTGSGITAKQTESCYGYSGGGTGLSANEAVNCGGYSAGSAASGVGLTASTATNCYGMQTGAGVGLNASIATGCYGTSGSGKGLTAMLATNCQGTTGGTTATAYGLDCGTGGVATGCYGNAGSATAFSIRAKVANGCALGTGSTAAITHNVNSF